MYADDTVLLASNDEGINLWLEGLKVLEDATGLTINKDKTFLLNTSSTIDEIKPSTEVFRLLYMNLLHQIMMWFHTFFRCFTEADSRRSFRINERPNSARDKNMLKQHEENSKEAHVALRANAPFYSSTCLNKQ